MKDYATRRRIMVDTQIRPADVTRFPVLEAMLSVEREAYLPDDRREMAYIDGNIDLGGGRVVLEPRTFAKMLQALGIGPDETVLDIGCAFGYSSAVIERLADVVVAVEEDAEMAAEAQSTLSTYGADSAAVVEGALAGGATRHGPYDVMVIEGGVEQVPEALTAQLKDGGRIAALFMEGAVGAVSVGYLNSGHVTWRHAFNASAPVLPGFAKEIGFSL